jgi:hypothetical protein
VNAGRALFLYWRTSAEQAHAATAAARRLQADLCERHAGLAARLYRRTGAELTLMETYSRALCGIDDALMQEIDSLGQLRLQPWLLGPRHLEVFEPADT